MQDCGNYYVIGHLSMITGLTDRTIRNYLNVGVLAGEKIDGVWHFTPEQVDQFLSHPMVRPSILAKNNAIVYDFLREDKKTSRQVCMILDIPNKDRKAIAAFFCERINSRPYQNMHFAFDGAEPTSRVILRGEAADIFPLVQEFQEEFKD